MPLLLNPDVCKQSVSDLVQSILGKLKKPQETESYDLSKQITSLKYLRKCYKASEPTGVMAQTTREKVSKILNTIKRDLTKKDLEYWEKTFELGPADAENEIA